MPKNVSSIHLSITQFTDESKTWYYEKYLHCSYIAEAGTQPGEKQMSVEKAGLRAVIRTRLRTLAADRTLAAGKSRSAASVFTESSLYRDSDAVLAFLSFGTEIQTHDLVRTMLADGKRVAIPRTFENETSSASGICESAGDARMEFYWLSREVPLEDQVEKGDFGILVPHESLEMADPAVLSENTLMVLPGVAFSKEGWRLGQGRGFYDRYLERIIAENKKHSRGKPFLAGYCYSLQIVDEVPHDEWDIPVSYVITEDSIIQCKA